MRVPINADMKMAELIHLDYHMALVINRFGIKLGFGDGTITDICNRHDIDPAFFIEIANTFHNKDYSLKDKLKDFSVKQTLSYLRASHNYYLHDELPKIERLIVNLIAANKSQKKQLGLMQNFFMEYRNELVAHIKREEVTVYPYAEAVEAAFIGKKPLDEAESHLAEYSMADYERDHEDVESKLLDLKNIIIKYLPPPSDNRFYNAILFNLFRLEADLNEHSRIENTVLVPAIRVMEKAIRKQNMENRSND